MNLIVQRFLPGHPLYSDATITNSDPKHGVVGAFQATFGQMLDEKGNFIMYTLERRDTLTPEGTYPFGYYFSPANQRKVLLLENVPGFTSIEVHIANYPYELKGCTACGSAIIPGGPMVSGSTAAFNKLMSLLAGSTGTIKYESLQNKAA